MNSQNINKSAIKVILLFVITFQLFSFQISGQTANRWYVDQDATGSNIGSSWNNAWTSLSGINWASVSAGDIIYVSGGTYSGTFSFGKSGTVGNIITVSGSYEEGHNDEVIISPSGSTGIQLAGRSYIRVNHLSVNGCGVGINVSSGNTIYVDSIKVRNSSDRMFYASGNTGGSWSSNLFIRWCDLQTTSSGQADGIYVQWYWENIDIEGNLIVIANTAISHMDGIQWSNYVRNIKVWNNWIQNNTPPSANRDSQGMMLASANGYIYIYNNVIYCPLFNGKSPCIYRTTYQGETGIYYVYNNTLITSGSYDVIRLEVDGAAYCKNNIIMDINTPYTGTTNWNGGIAWIWTPDDYSKIDANLFTTSLVTSSTYQIGSNPTQRSMASMYSLGGEHQGSYITRDRVNPLFTTTVTGSLDYTAVNLSLQEGSPAIDGGVNLQSEVEARGMAWESFNNPYISWANGGPRGSTPDIGAFEFVLGGNINNPPSQPSNPDPGNNSTGQSISITISWNCTDPDGNPLVYDIYFGTDGNPTVISSNQSNSTFNPGQLNTNTIYYWKIVAKDNQGAITAGPVWNFTTISSDVTPPELVSASLLDSLNLQLTFSEVLESSSAQLTYNYEINNGITVNQASLSTDGKTVTLLTSIHQSNIIYNVLVSNVKDLAGNLISLQYNSFQYEYYGGDELVQLPIFNASADDWYQNYTPDLSIDGIPNGDSRWGGGSAMPDTISYNLGDVQIINQSRISFYQWNTGRIYNYTVQVSTDSINWQDVKSNITSANQEWSVENIDPVEAKFIRVISLSNNQSIYAGINETEFWGHLKIFITNLEDEKITPNSFVLEQNYPNPFNPSTMIRVSIPKSTRIRLAVYNILGEYITELANGQYNSGVYEFSFNATGLASGIYIYRIESSAFIDTKKMMVMK